MSGSVTVNAAFFQEIKEDNLRLRELLQAVTGELDGRPIGRGRMTRFANLMGQLRDQLALHFSLEEAYGYFNDAVAAAPEMSLLAESLRAQHGALYVQVSRIAKVAESVASQSHHERCLHVFTRTKVFFDQLQKHERRENELVAQIYDDDVGVGD